jgi:hypothetical protein
VRTYASIARPSLDRVAERATWRRKARRTAAWLAAVALLVGLTAVASGALPGTALAASGSAALQPAQGQYFPTGETTVLDTNNGTGGYSTPIASGGTDTVQVTGVGSIPAGVSDVYMAVEVISPSSAGCLNDYDTDLGDPTVAGICDLSFDAGSNASLTDIAQVSSAGTVSFTNESGGTVGVAAVVFGYYQDGTGSTAGETYVPVAQQNVGSQTQSIPGGGQITVQVAGVADIPSAAVGAALSIGLKNGTAAGYISAWPTGGSSNSSPTISYLASGAVVHGMYQGALSASGQITILNQGSAAVTITVGSEGYFLSPAASPAGSAYIDVPQAVAASTTNGTGGVTSQAIPANGSITYPVEGVDGIPASGVSAVVEDIRAYQPQNTGFLTVYAAGGTDPGQPGVNFTSGMDEGNNITVPMVSSSGQQTITNHSSGTVQVIVALRGYYQPPAAPSAPDDVTATVSGSTATITWESPYGDGGSPITGFTVTAPPETANVTVAGNVYQATLSGLTTPESDTFEVTATNAAGTGDWQATLQAVGSSIAEQDVGISAGPDTDPTTNPATTIDSNSTLENMTASGVESQALTPNTSEMSEQTMDDETSDPEVAAIKQNCAQFGNNTAKVDGVVPKYLSSFNNYAETEIKNSAGNKAGEAVISWLNKLYGVNNAKYDGNQLMWMAMTCTTGGGHVDGSGLAENLSENVLVTNSSDSNTIQGYNWATKVTSQSTVTTTKGLSLGAANSGASVGLNASQAVTTIVAHAKEQGNIGPDWHLGSLYKLSSSWDPNRVDTDWIANDGDGLTSNMEGNVALAYYWYPMNSGHHNFYSVAALEICAGSTRNGTFNCIEIGHTVK